MLSSSPYALGIVFVTLALMWVLQMSLAKKQAEPGLKPPSTYVREIPRYIQVLHLCERRSTKYLGTNARGCEMEPMRAARRNVFSGPARVVAELWTEARKPPAEACGHVRET